MRRVFLIALGSLTLAACSSPPPDTSTSTGEGSSTGSPETTTSGTTTSSGSTSGGATGTGTTTGTGAGASGTTGAPIPPGTLWLGGANALSPDGGLKAGANLPQFDYTCPPVATLAAPAQGGAEVIDGLGDLWTQFSSAAPSNTISKWSPAQLENSCASRKADATFTISQTNIAAMAFDNFGNLWASAPSSNVIAGYASSFVHGDGGNLGAAYLLNQAPVRNVTTLFNPTGLAFDALGNLWVGNYYSILLYHPGTLAGAASNGGNSQIPPDAFLTSTGAQDVELDGGTFNSFVFQYLAFDGSGNLWATVQNFTSDPATYQIVEFSASQLTALATNNTPTPTFVINETADQVNQAFPGYSGIAFDSAGNLWAGAHLANPNIWRFPAGNLGGTNSGAPDIIVNASNDNTGSRAFTMAFDPIPQHLPIKPGT